MRAGPSKDGIQSADAIMRLADAGVIKPEMPFASDQIQPASLDLRLGRRAYRVRASFLPGRNHTVQDRLDQLSFHEIDLSRGAILETGSVYIAELQEELALPGDLSAAANPKSSTGRIDVFTRVIADRSQEFDTIGAGYDGPLFAEISPRTFPVLVRSGTRLSQLRLRKGEVRLSDAELHALHRREKIVTSAEPSIQDGVAVSVDLAGSGPVLHPGLQGGRARAAGLCRRDGPVRPAGGRVSRALCRFLRSRLRPCGGRRRGRPRRARGAVPGRAVHSGAWPDRRSAGLRTDGRE